MSASASETKNDLPVAIVTGSTSGIGLAIVHALIAEGFYVVGTFCNSSAETFFRQNESLIDSPYFSLRKLNITDLPSIPTFFKMLRRDLGVIDCLVNNAGVPFGQMATLTSQSNLKMVFETNFFSQVNMIQNAFRLLRKSSQPSIVNISSISAYRDDMGSLAYSCSKAALHQATRIFARELAPYGIRVNSVAPGITKTPMLDEMSLDAVELQIKSSCLSKIATPQDVANLVAFLCSDSSLHITSQCFKVDGGQLC